MGLKCCNLDVSLATCPWISEPCALGIDEAGRGPVVGPMVYACAVTPVTSLEALKQKKFADSKTLSEEQRDELFAGIAKDDTIAYALESITAQAISVQMTSRAKVSLNAMAEDATCKLIEGALQDGCNLTQVFIDTVGDAERYSARLTRKFPGICFTVCPKADALYPIVSAASIVAKVSRDNCIRQFGADLNSTLNSESNSNSNSGKAGSQVSLGSGYPGDPDTKAWLRTAVDSVFGYPDIVRFSWETCSRLLDELAVPVHWDTDENEGSGQGQQSLFNFMAASNKSSESSGAGRHSFFRARKLQPLFDVADVF